MINMAKLLPVKNKRARFDSGVYVYRPNVILHTRKKSAAVSDNTDMDFSRCENNNFFSTSTVPSIGDQVSTKLGSAPIKSNKKLISKRRLIMKNKKTKQATKEFRDLLTKDNMVNEIMQAKINYFFKPYSGDTTDNVQQHMSFNEKEQDSPRSEVDLDNSQEVRNNWKYLSTVILRNDDDEFRKILTKINPSMYCRLKSLGEQFYLNKFMKNSEIVNGSQDQKNSFKNDDSSTESTGTTFDPVSDGIGILKSLILDKIATKVEEKQVRSHFHSTNPKELNSLYETVKKGPKRKKRVTMKSKISWKNAETLIPCQYLSRTSNKIDTDKLYKGMMKEWQDEKNYKQLKNGSSEPIDFNASSKNCILKGNGRLPSVGKNQRVSRKLRVSTKDLKSSTMNSEKFILELHKKRDSKRLAEFSSQSLTRGVKRFMPLNGSTLNIKKDLSRPQLKPLMAPKRIKVLTPLCLNSSCSSAL